MTGDMPRGDSTRGSSTNQSPLAALARELMAEDPADAPLPMRRSPAWAGSFTRWTPRANGASRSIAAARGPPSSRGAEERQAVEALAEAWLSRRANAIPSVGRYRLLDKLGEGGQGVVYRALDPADESIVAIKVLRSDHVENAVVRSAFTKRPG